MFANFLMGVTDRIKINPRAGALLGGGGLQGEGLAIHRG